MSLISPTEAERLAKICGLFSSNHTGERAAAAHKADQLVRAAGLTWPDILQVPDCRPERQKASRSYPSRLTPAEALTRHRAHLTDWERTFLTSLTRKRSCQWSARQTEIFEEIHERILRGGR